MKTKDIKRKGKRSISILTIFLWISLIAVMTVITISGINKNNSLEENKKSITIKIDMEEFYGDCGFSVPYCYVLQNNKSVNVSRALEGSILVGSADVEADSEYSILISMGNYDVLEGDNSLDVIEVIGQRYYCRNVEKDDMITEYNFKLQNFDTKVQSKIKWLDKENGKAQIIDKVSGMPRSKFGAVIFIEKLPSNFVLSDEYQDLEEWEIVDENELSNSDKSSLDKYGFDNDISNYIYHEFFTYKFVRK